MTPKSRAPLPMAMAQRRWEFSGWAATNKFCMTPFLHAAKISPDLAYS